MVCTAGLNPWLGDENYVCKMYGTGGSVDSNTHNYVHGCIADDAYSDYERVTVYYSVWLDLGRTPDLLTDTYTLVAWCMCMKV